ncbi:MAG: 50S ribosomal protein L15 [Chloroflexota bacterium]
MQLHDLKPAPGSHKDRRRLGRGHGSGRGTTAGRGSKGQKARAGGQVNPRFEGGQLPMVLRLPRKRGFTNRNRIEYAVLNVSDLQRFEADSAIDPQSLFELGIVKKRRQPVKILGTGELDRPLTVRAHKFSASARQKIEAAGGKAEEIGAEGAEAAEA